MGVRQQYGKDTNVDKNPIWNDLTAEQKLDKKLAYAQKRKESQKNKQQSAHVENRIGAYLSNDVSPIPSIVNPQRRESTKYNFQLYCETYYQDKFNLIWSEDHIKLMQTMQTAVLEGMGLHAFACFRGFGKTSLAETLAQWSILHGHKKFVVIIAATQAHAKDLTAGLILDLETNPLLLEDFPEACYPVICLDRNFARSNAQHNDGAATRILYKKETFVYPTIEGSACSGSKIHSVGITGSLRGLKHLLVDGKVIRPDLVMIDDPQTDKSAKSDMMIAARERIINGAILGLSGPRSSITAVMPCTVIRHNDLADRFLDNTKKPEWQGIRTSLLHSLPKNMDLWRRYAEIRSEGLRNKIGVKEATDFYRLNQTQMDEGAVASWKERFDPRYQISAVQAAMDIYFTNPVAFWSEYQNNPLREGDQSYEHVLTLTLDKLLQRCNGLKYRYIPRDTLYLTSGIDIQAKILYYMTVAWREDFGGSIVDYGTYPKQPSFDGWTAQNPPIILCSDNPELDIRQKVFFGLNQIKDDVFSKAFIRMETDERTYIQKSLIDANWSLSSDAVYEFCTKEANNNIFLPSHGRGVSATMVPMDQWAKKQGEIRKWNARILPSTTGANKGKHASYDGNAWKSLLAERLITDLGSSKALTIYGDNGYIHQLMFEHFLKEKPNRKKGRGREVDEWTTDESMPENHFWDCLIQAAVAANLLGLNPHIATDISETGQSVTAPITIKTRKVVENHPSATFVQPK